jgi:6,7-dimethyl-8-ribityllumazine synthase
MVRHYEGKLLAGDEAYGIVVARFNDLVTRRLLEGAVDTFRRHGVDADRISVAWVPGSFEIPVVADRWAKSGRFAAVCCLGAVIQGETTHHEYINHQVAAAIMRAGQESGVPVLFGVLTCQNMEQALDRAGGKAGNKGSECALAALEMVDLLRQLSDDRTSR